MEKKNKKEKKVVVPFDQIDIKTATEDEIIKSGIKHNVKSDFICFAIMGLIVVLMLLPPILRMVNPKPITEVEKEIVYVKLSCTYPTSIENYSFYTEVNNKYRDGSLQNLEIKYSYKKKNDVDENTDGEGEIKENPVPDEEPTFAPIEKMKEVDAPGFSYKKVENGYIFTGDFENYNLYSVEQLKDYSYVSGAESDYLISIGFYCSTESETVKERVYVDTNKKVE